MNNKDNVKKGKISLTGSLASLAREVQNDEPKEMVNESVEKPILDQKIVSKKGKSNFDEVIKFALELKSNPSKLSTVYVYENIKKDLEALKRIDGLENVPLTALMSAIIDDFLRHNTVTIKELLNQSGSRF